VREIPSEPVKNAEKEIAKVAAEGLSEAQVLEIRAAIQAQEKIFGRTCRARTSLGTRRRGIANLFCYAEKRPFAEMIEGRETIERVRIASSKVLGACGSCVC